MIEFKPISRIFGDETQNYDVKTNAKSVAQFIEQILKERSNDWGTICIKKANGLAHSICVCEYKRGKITRQAVKYNSYGTAKIQSIFSNGGWSSMNYVIKVKDFDELPMQSRKEFRQVYFGWE